MAPSWKEMTLSFGRIGLLSFGGPAAQIGLMHREFVETRAWLDEAQFLRALSFCMLLPGPEAMQLATYTGWRLRGVWGGVLGGALFVLPGALVIGLLAGLYIAYGALPEVSAAMLGIKAAVIAIVFHALAKLARKTLTRPAAWAVALASFLGLFVFQIPFPLILLAAALLGIALRDQSSAAMAATAAPRAPSPLWVLALWAALWLAPLPLLALFGQELLFDLAAFFGKLAVVTFGGAYAVLAYMSQEVVHLRGWLTAEQMVDALGLAETTPGPLILVTQFVGTLAGAAQGGWPLALAAGVLTLWMTFIPCFLWIFAGAPYIEILLARPRINAAFKGITMAVVGVIANLSVWFAMHVLFTQTTQHALPFGQIERPVWASLDPNALAFVALAFALMRLFKGQALPLIAALGFAATGIAVM